VCVVIRLHFISHLPLCVCCY